ncbi:m000.5L [Myxoma virus]|uniref:M000.5L n=1 Tax=Myxoma virus TaxID=10273 RepID=A0A481NA11_9POXV|nr:m000.5L [Myxoma virus]
MVVRRVSDDVDLSYTRLFRFGGGRVYVCPRIGRVFVFLRLPEEIEYIDRPRSSRGYDGTPIPTFLPPLVFHV